MNPRDGAKPIDLTGFRKALEDRRLWCGLAVVAKREGESSHFEIETDDAGNKVDILVEVDLMPEGIPATCRLGIPGSNGAGSGIFAIPAVGTEVVWCAPHGDLEADLMIVGALSTRSIPDVVDETTLVILGPKNVVIASTDASSKVKVGAKDGSTNLQPAVVGDDLETRLSTIENKLKNHTHSFSYATPSSSSGTTTSATANGGTSADVGTPPTIKSTTTEVAK